MFFPCRDGSKLAHAVLGKKSNRVPVIMITGLSGVMSDWHDLPVILSKDRQVAVLENRFLGQSFVANAPSYRFRDMVEAVVDLADFLGWNRVVLIGWSMGGMISQAVAASFPVRVAGLVLLGSAASSVPETPPGTLLLMLVFL